MPHISEVESSGTEEPDPAMQQADKLRVSGNDRYKTGKYEEAIMLYSNALSELQDARGDPAAVRPPPHTPTHPLPTPKQTNKQTNDTHTACTRTLLHPE